MYTEVMHMLLKQDQIFLGYNFISIFLDKEPQFFLLQKEVREWEQGWGVNDSGKPLIKALESRLLQRPMEEQMEMSF